MASTVLEQNPKTAKTIASPDVFPVAPQTGLKTPGAIVAASDFCSKIGVNNFSSNRPIDSIAADCTLGKKITQDTRINGINLTQKLVSIGKLSDEQNVIRIFNPVANPHQYLIFIVTDGTGNTGEQFIPERSGRYKPESCLGMVENINSKSTGQEFVKLPSNPRILFNQIAIDKQKNVVALYERGVGTDPNVGNDPTTDITNGISSAGGTSGVITQVNNTMRRVRSTIEALRATDPLAGFVFVTAGFSRGAAAARIINHRLIGDKELRRLLKNDAIVGATILFDTVASFNNPVFANLLTQELSVPSQVLQGIHITAENEYRSGFPLTPVPGASVVSYLPNGSAVVNKGSFQNFLEFSVPGAHSDIGGTYTTDGISAFTLEIAMKYLDKLGIQYQPLHPVFQPNLESFAIHDSRFCADVAFEKQILESRIRK